MAGIEDIQLHARRPGNDTLRRFAVNLAFQGAKHLLKMEEHLTSGEIEAGGELISGKMRVFAKAEVERES